MLMDNKKYNTLSKQIEIDKRLSSKLKRRLDSSKGNPNNNYYKIRDIFIKIESDFYKCDVIKYLTNKGINANLDIILKTLSIEDDYIKYNILKSINLNDNYLNFVVKNLDDDFIIKSIKNYSGKTDDILLGYFVSGIKDNELRRQYFINELRTDEQRLIAARDFTDEEKLASLITFEDDMSKLELIQTINDDNLINTGINMLSKEFKNRIYNILSGLKGVNNNINFKSMISLIYKVLKDTLSTTNGFVIVEPNELGKENKLVK